MGPPAVGGAPALLLGGGFSDLTFVVLPVSAPTLHAGALTRAEGSMGKLIYAANISLDFDDAEPDLDEVQPGAGLSD